MARAPRIPHRPVAAAFTAIAAMLAAAPLSAQVTYDLDGQTWQARDAPDPDSPEGEIQAIRRLLAEERPRRAEQRAEAWLDDHEDHPLRVEALLLRADAKVARRRYYDALFIYEQIIRGYPQTPQYETALQREFEIARLFVEGLNRRILGMRLFPADGEGEELLIRIQERAPGSRLGEAASLLLADYYFEKGQMGLASDAYDLFIINYPRSENREWAHLRLIQASLARFRGPGFDKTGLLDARQRLRTYREQYPAAAERIGAAALLARIDESLARHALISARWYESRGELVSAAYLYRRIVAEHPRTATAREALRRFERVRNRTDLTGLPAVVLEDAGDDAAEPLEISPSRGGASR